MWLGAVRDSSYATSDRGEHVIHKIEGHGLCAIRSRSRVQQSLSIARVLWHVVKEGKTAPLSLQYVQLLLCFDRIRVTASYCRRTCAACVCQQDCGECSTPFTSLTIPGDINAEDFDVGGEVRYIL